MDLKAKADAILTTIEGIRRKREEINQLLLDLNKQAYLMLQGIDPELVTHYGYDPSLDKRGTYHRHDHGIGMYNYVFLKDGTRINTKLAKL